MKKSFSIRFWLPLGVVLSSTAIVLSSCGVSTTAVHSQDLSGPPASMPARLGQGYYYPGQNSISPMPANAINPHTEIFETMNGWAIMVTQSSDHIDIEPLPPVTH